MKNVLDYFRTYAEVFYRVARRKFDGSAHTASRFCIVRSTDTSVLIVNNLGFSVNALIKIQFTANPGG